MCSVRWWKPPRFSQQICHTSTRYIHKKDFFFVCMLFFCCANWLIHHSKASTFSYKAKKKKELIRCSVTVVNIKHSFPLGHSLHFIIHLRAYCMEMNKFCLTMTWNVNTCIPTASVYPFKGEFEMRRVAYFSVSSASSSAAAAASSAAFVLHLVCFAAGITASITGMLYCHNIRHMREIEACLNKLDKSRNQGKHI